MSTQTTALAPFRRGLSIQFKLGVVVAAVLGLIAIGISLYVPSLARASAATALAGNVGTVARITAFGVAPALDFEDRVAAVEALRGVEAATTLAYVVVEDAKGEVFASLHLDAATSAGYRSTQAPGNWSGGYYRTSAAVTQGDRTLGTVYAGASLAPLRIATARARGTAGLAAGLLFLLATSLTVAAGSLLIRPLAAMAATARGIADGHWDERAPVRARDEAGELATAINLMLDHLEDARRNLRTLNEQLETRVADRTRALEHEASIRQQSQAALESANQRFELAAAALEGAIYDWDVALGRVSWTDGLTRVFGYPVEEVPPTAAFREANLHPDDRERVLAQLAEELANGHDFRCEYRFRARDGSYLTVLDRGRVIRDDGGRAVRMVGILVNISNLRQLEEQYLHAQRMEAVGRLAGGVAHDFNNLLTAILGYSDLTLETLEPDDPNRGNLEEIRNAGERAAALTQQLLTFSRKQVVDLRVLDPAVVVGELDKMLRRLIGEDIVLETHAEQGLLRIRADRAQIEQIIMNIALNARDAMPQGGRITISIDDRVLDASSARTHLGAEPGPYVCFEITDTGYGMDAATLARVFEPFFTTKEVGKGTGLGLAIVYGIVKQSGGGVEVESSPGAGTTVRVYLPLVASDDLTLAATPHPGPLVRGTETVLVVEDEVAVRRMISGLLRSQGYRTSAASTPEEALALARTTGGGFDLLVTDLVMPGMSGRDLADLLHEEGRIDNTLFISGYSDDLILRLGQLSHGNAAFLAKPFKPNELLGRIREVLDASRD